MYLLFDPYTNRQWSMMDIRLVNKVADALLSENENLDPSEIVGAIRNVFRPGMSAEPLRVHATRRLKSAANRREPAVEYI